MSVVIINYEAGNLGSIVNMFRKCGVTATVSADHDTIQRATHLVLPGVGAFDHGMRQLVVSGVRDVLEKRVLAEKTPILGICLGMQMVVDRSEEGTERGLGWIPGTVTRFDSSAFPTRLKVPHMGWNYVATQPGTDTAPRIDEGSRFYFVHSYHVVCDRDEHVWGRTIYGYAFASAIRSENIFGVQFHPEKSHRFGCDLLRRFADYRA